MGLAKFLGQHRRFTMRDQARGAWRCDAGPARVTARVLRKGKNLVFGEIEVADAQGWLAAHATTTYALL